MKKLNRENATAKLRPERVIQFGEGNFLRAFVDWIIYRMNEKTDFNGNVVVVQPIENGMIDMLNEQDGLYHVNLQGVMKKQTVDSLEMIDVISRAINPYTEFEAYLALAEQPEMRFVVSNTTEAGIAFSEEDCFGDRPAKSYPGKLTQLLYHRFKTFGGALDKGFIIMPCELIFHNGEELERCINQYIQHWGLGKDFKEWFDKACHVYSTLVDRIVPGYPADTIEEIKEKIQFDDKLVVKGEIFHLWVIEAPAELAEEFPVTKADLNVLIVPDEKPFHVRKVIILNGTHTVMSPIGFLCGVDTVKEVMDDELIYSFLEKLLFNELKPTIQGVPEDRLMKFTGEVLDRFANPYVKHYLTSIMLNAFPKFKARVVPPLKRNIMELGIMPHSIILGLAAIITYYKGGDHNGEPIVPNDDPAIVDFIANLWKENTTAEIAQKVLAADFIWEEDLNLIPGLTAELSSLLESIKTEGVHKTVEMIANA